MTQPQEREALQAAHDVLTKQGWRVGDTFNPEAVALTKVAAALSQPQSQAQGEAVAKIVAVDEYGPRIEWTKHWADLIGSNLYAAPVAAQQGLSDEEIDKIAARLAVTSSNVTRFHELSGRTLTTLDDEGLAELANAILSRAAPQLPAAGDGLTDEHADMVGRMRGALYTIAHSYDEGELRTKAAEAWEESFKLAAPAAPAAPATSTQQSETGTEWRDGEPPFPQREEWFIAETIYGDRVVLKALPEEYTYDYHTADETYMKAANIKRWMQFPDCEFVEPTSPDSAAARDAERLDALARESWDLHCFDTGTGQGDGDIGWRVIEHHEAKPHERVVAEVFKDDPRAAIDAALAAQREGGV